MPTSKVTPRIFAFGNKLQYLKRAEVEAAPNITKKGIIIHELIVCIKAVFPAIFDFPYSFPYSSLSSTPIESSLFLIKVIFVALAELTAIQLNIVDKKSFLVPLNHEVRGAKSLLRPTAIPIELVTAPTYPLSISAVV